MPENKHNQEKSFSSMSRWGIGINVFLTLVAVLGIAAMVNYLAARYSMRFQWATQSRMELSSQTRSLLGQLTNSVQVYSYFSSDHPLSSHVNGLLKEYERHSPMIQLKRVDNILNPQAAAEIKTRFNLSKEKNAIIFEFEGRRRVVIDTELADFVPEPTETPGEYVRKMTHFHGERLFTSAILNVLEAEAIKVYFTTGHGEHPVTSGESMAGYSQFARLLSETRVESHPLLVQEVAEIPPDCRLLVIAGPKKPYSMANAEKIDRYLQQGGRALILFHMDPVLKELEQGGLEKILARWGIAAGANALHDGNESAGFLVQTFQNHPITSPLWGHALYLVMPRSIQPIENGQTAGDAPRVIPLAQSEPQTRWLRHFRQANPVRTPNDQIGPAVIAVAVEKGNIKGVSADRGTTRMVVAGDSLFLANDLINEGANADFGRLTVNWLLDRTHLLSGIGPKEMKEYRLTMNQKQLTRFRWVLLAGLPGAVLLMGMLVWLTRRN
jgi:ABC-type uncharacterized transport system involved in gliding motility auxiliary subunit